MSVLRQICINPKVVGAVIVIAATVFVLAPHLAALVIPLLLLASCPLSMLLARKALMRRHHTSRRRAAIGASPTIRRARPACKLKRRLGCLAALGCGASLREWR